MWSFEYNSVICHAVTTHQHSFPHLLSSIPGGLLNETAQITSVGPILTTDRTQSLLLRAQGCNKAQPNTVTYKHLSSIYRGLMYLYQYRCSICYEIDSSELVGFHGVCVRSVSDNNGQHRITRPCVCHNGCI